jgi:putative membrane protein
LLSQPLVAWSSFGISIWVWHAPVFYQAALDNPAIHVLEHATFLATAIVFWWFLLQPARRKITRYGTAVLYLFTTLLHVSVLGGLLTFSAQTWIPAYTASAGIGGLSPLQDQQLAGLIMWLPGGVLFTILTVLTFGAWLQVVEQRMQEKERSQQGYSRMRRQGQAHALKRRVQIEKLGTGERNEQKIG